MTLTIGNNKIEILAEKNKIKINEIEFDEITDFVYFVNKLTDLAEELLEEK